MMDVMSIISCSIMLVSLFSFQPLLILQAAKNDLKTYIVHVQNPTNVQHASYTNHDQKIDLESWHRSFLPTTNCSDYNISGEFKLESKSRLVHSYRHVFNGFAARLTREEVKEMENKIGFISAQVQEILTLDTTHSPEYMGLIQNSGFWKESNYGKGVIIGVIDSGIKRSHASFRGDGISPPPAKWNGRCEIKRKANPKICNNKLIGVKNVISRLGSIADNSGHGTHVAGIAAGNYVQGANVCKNVNGTAKGVAPLAHLAIYKACNKHTKCSEAHILAAIDIALNDKVDILSISLSLRSEPFHISNIAIGAFRAMEWGILVCTSAGNDGPYKSTLKNEAPWMLVVGASTIDRNTIAIAKLGNNKELVGQSIYQPKVVPSRMLPLIYPGSLNTQDDGKPYCQSDSFNYIDIKGKYVVCVEGGGIEQKNKGEVVKNAGGAGMILINEQSSGYTITDEVHVLPTVHLNYVDGVELIRYIKSSNSPIATILYKGTSIDPSQTKPTVACFSARGPSTQSPGILKPDILGPGVNILSASPFSVDKKKSLTSPTFDIKSGTSMACPHLTGVAALLKSKHPHWSPTAIMSAIITTADINYPQLGHIEDESHQRANIFATGAGHVNPSRAKDPGLVYLIHEMSDYLAYLCGLGYTSIDVSKIAQRNIVCSKKTSIPESQLNYPSILVLLDPIKTVEVSRTVTNFGDAIESYDVFVTEPPGVLLTIEPTTLSFMKINQKLTYKVTFKRLSTATDEFAEGSLTWTSKKHNVRSPIVAIFK